MAKLRTLLLLLLFSAAALLEAFRLSSLSALTNCDIWWHLSSGLWILHSHGFPHSGLFSQASAQSWSASSWGYELLLAASYKVLGLRSIPFFLMKFKAALAVLTFLLAGGIRGKFWPAVGLSVIAQFILAAIPPGPAYLSVLFFGIELLILLEARRSGSSRLLWWLVPLLLVWANLHMQFVYGVAVLLLFLGVIVVERSGQAQKLRVARAWEPVLVAIAAALVTPYLWGGYAAFFRTTFNSANTYLPDFQALGFRQPQDYILLLLAMSAFLVLGLQRSRDVFQIGLLAGCLGLSFYSRRDIWLVTLAALAVIGEALTDRPAEDSVSRKQAECRRVLFAAGAAVALAIVALAVRVPSSREALLAKTGQSYPVAACDYIRNHRLAQPLFNAYEWGGFLTWYLPEYPVAIDSRTDLYGGDTVAEYSKVMNADLRYTEFPPLADAQTILLPKGAIMASALGSVPVFKLAYSDDVAVVLTRRSPNE